METTKEIEARRATAREAKIIERVPDEYFYTERKRLAGHLKMLHNPYNPKKYGVPSPCVKVRCSACGNEQYTFISNLKEAVSKCNSCGVFLRDCST